MVRIWCGERFTDCLCEDPRGLTDSDTSGFGPDPLTAEQLRALICKLTHIKVLNTDSFPSKSMHSVSRGNNLLAVIILLNLPSRQAR